MTTRSTAVLGLVLSFAGAAAAQSTKPEPPRTEAAKPESAEAAAAMERAQRMATNPMRVILQASKIRRKGEGESGAAPAPDPVRPAGAAPQALRVPATASAAPPLSVAASPAVASVPVSTPATPAAAAQPEPGVVTSLVLQAAPPRPEPAPVVPALERVAPAASDSVAKLAVPQAVLAAVNVQPRLASMVEPDVPLRLRIEVQQATEVLADLTLRADGSVAEVALLPPYPRPWQRYLVAALERWRFDPLPSGRVHRVQLVFDAP